MQITTIGLDIAKNVFQVHCIDAGASGFEKVIGRAACAYRDLWNVAPFPASVRFDAHELHHLAPFVGLFHDELAKVTG